MDNEVYRDLTHDEVETAVLAWVIESGARAKRQFTLPDGKIADVIIERPDGHIDIVECKDHCSESIVQAAHNKYYTWCSHLWIAVPRPYEFATRVRRWTFSWDQMHDRCGFLLVTRDGVSVLLDAEAHFITESHHHTLWKYLRFEPRQGRAFEAE